MNTRIALVGLAAGAAVVAACQTVAAQGGAEPLDVRQNMVEGVNPAAMAIWDVGNAALDDSGGLDPALMDEAAWAKMQEAATTLGTYAHRMAVAQVIRASGPDLVGGKVPEGVASREQIQAMIDANPDGFRAMAATMEQQAGEIARAAKARDIKAAGELVFTFDGTCQSCHENYWYLKQ